MYIVVNFNSFLLAFQKFEDGKFVFAGGFDNFKQAFFNLKNDPMLVHAAKNALVYFGISLIFSTLFCLMFSFYIYKKKFGSEFFKFVLFLPSIVSGIIMVILFKYMADRAVPAFIEKLFHKQFQGLIADPKYTWSTIIFYNLFMSFGGNMLIYSGTMKDIPESVVEAAQLDGITPMKEFFYITLPTVYPILVTFLVAGVAGIFTNQLNLFSFFGTVVDNRYQTFGYYMYTKMLSKDPFSYPYLATLSLIFSFISIPVTLIARKMLIKFGPSED
ncbi:MAG: sugar ABC transporter permease [Clostridia bacterium]|nr:sugar ABC transporter permease [Clostridia bacterium]